MKKITFGFIIGIISSLAIPGYADWDILYLDQFLNDLLTSEKAVKAKTFTSIREAGTAVTVRKPNDSEARWRIQSDGIMLWGNGSEVPPNAFGPTHATSGGNNKRVLFELSSNEQLPLGITLNAKGNNGGSISITNETINGVPCLAIRYENAGSTPIASIPSGCM